MFAGPPLDTKRMRHFSKEFEIQLIDTIRRLRELSKARIRSAANRIQKRQSIPSSGFNDNRVDSGFIEQMSDDDLARLNAMLPWMCFTSDSKGRRFGDIAWRGKRDTPQAIPDRRIVAMNQAFGLRDSSVLEIGCFEGIHTIGLAQFARDVYAVDARIENVVKTIVRAAMFGYSPRTFVCDIEDEVQIDKLPAVDFVHHVGVLYHLRDPISHLVRVGRIAKHGFLLDTHYATPEMTNATYVAAGREIRYFKYIEKGREEVFSGMYDHAKWLLLDDIRSTLACAGFSEFRMLEDNKQRNGPRFTALVSRP